MERQPRKVRLPAEVEPVTGTYEIHAKCNNCDWTGRVNIPKGKPVAKDSALEGLARCESCGCFTLVRIAAVATPSSLEEMLRQHQRPFSSPSRLIDPIWPDYTDYIPYYPPYRVEFTDPDIRTTSSSSADLASIANPSVASRFPAVNGGCGYCWSSGHTADNCPSLAKKVATSIPVT